MNFDRDKVFDAYTGALLFKAQTSSFDDSSATGATARRRVMSVSAGISSPARHAVTINGETWVVGDSNSDGFMGTIVRKNFALKKSTGLMKLLTPAQACLSAAGLDIHTHKQYFKDTDNRVTDSGLDPFWLNHCALNEAVSTGSFFLEGALLLRVRNNYKIQEGYIIAECDQLEPNALQAAVFTSTGTYNVVTDTLGTSNISTTVIQTDVPKFYKFRTIAEDPQQPGDRTVFVAKSAVTPAVSTRFTMLGSSWRVLSVNSELDSWALHVRLA
jgi:hypothetical protein